MNKGYTVTASFNNLSMKHFKQYIIHIASCLVFKSCPH